MDTSSYINVNLRLFRALFGDTVKLTYIPSLINDYISGDSDDRLKLRRHLKKCDGDYLVAPLRAGAVA